SKHTTRTSHSQGHSSPARSSFPSVSSFSSATATDPPVSAASVTPSRLANSSGEHASNSDSDGSRLRTSQPPPPCRTPGTSPAAGQAPPRPRPGQARRAADELVHQRQEEPAAAPLPVLAADGRGTPQHPGRPVLSLQE